MRGWGGLGLVAAAYGAYRMYKSRRAHAGVGAPARGERPYGEGRDLVDEGSWESFPASDPPSTMPPGPRDRPPRVD